MKKRIDKLGVTQPNVSLDAGRDLILVELPGIDDKERARQFLKAAAKLEFWNVYRFNDPVNPNQPGGPNIVSNLFEADRVLKSALGVEDELQMDTITNPIYAVDRIR